TYNSDKKSGQLTAKLTDFNQNGLRPFLEPLLADKRLVSVAINATANAQFNPDGDASVKADLQVANLVVNDPKGQLPATPLGAKWLLDASVRKQVADLRQCQITLTPSSRGKNELGLTGQVDYSRTNAITGNLKLAAESLDVTSYYDLFVGKTAEKKTPAQPTPTQPTAAPSEQLPATKSLPFRNLIVE